MTWDTYHRRKSVLKDVFAIADRERDITLAELNERIPAISETFEDEITFLLDIQMTWYQRLSGQLDRIGGNDAAPADIARTGWINAAVEMPGARALLDAHLERPELAKALANERALLAGAAGLTPNHPQFASYGRELWEAARAEVVYPAPLDDEQRPGLLSRLRNALAA